MVEDRDSYYSWAPLVDSLLDAYESQGDFQTVIEVEKANETVSYVSAPYVSLYYAYESQRREKFVRRYVEYSVAL